jgi:anti-sigma-K factor RskA
MNGHPTREEDFDLYALGALEGEEKRALEQHLAGCADCARRFDEARGRVALLALAAPPHSPPPRVKARLLQQVQASEPASPGREAEKRAGIFGSWWTAVWAPAAVVLAVFTVLLWVSNNRLNRELQKLNETIADLKNQNKETQAMLELATAPDTVKVALIPSPDMPKAWGQVDYNPRMGMLSYSGDLPSPPSDKAYQLWLVPASGNPISAGVFRPRTGVAVFSFMKHVPPGMAAKAFAVTVEPAGGMPLPTGPKVLIGPVS